MDLTVVFAVHFCAPTVKSILKNLTCSTNGILTEITRIMKQTFRGSK